MFRSLNKVGEFNSSGESVRVKSTTVGRIHHLFSENELAEFLMFDWCEEVIDIREQFPIPLIMWPNSLCQYREHKMTK